MGELADDFRFMDEQRAKHRAQVEPERVTYAIEQLKKAGHTVQKIDDQSLKINGRVMFWPFTGWFSGKGVGSGRGIKNLLRQLDGSK